MAAIKGSEVTLSKGDGASPEVFTPIAGSRNINFQLGGNDIDVTTADDIAGGVTWRTYLSGIIDFTASFDGILKDADAYDDLVTDRLAGTVSNYELEIAGYGTFSGPMRVTQLEGGGQFDDAATFSVTLRAASALTWTKAP